ncbi:nuclear transport factor 2 family protein [Sphingomonas crocodyli]|uniref:Nuclear transport factor 2 family protein n=1 Tax=Sphingomonas crocodyli TaxID=1979270 RepID=A0A437M8F2_9SPHN|nr:nuclear transport factor 2 family protein [Sphingomonas crocodyli]RVT94008.1 nuclear transport factor 2 family protein [Sphingomonas crocodyli]
MTKVTTDDWVAISDHLGRYCWFVDEGMGEEWAALWEPEGVFIGVTPEPIKGRAALSFVSTSTYEQLKGRLRHIAANLHADYADGTRDIVHARYYNYVSRWDDTPGNFTFAICRMTLVRDGDGWLIRENNVELFAPPLQVAQ